jgi:hypothetical protein
MGLCQAVVNVGPQRMQRNLTLNLFLGAGNFSATQSATNNDLNAFGIGTHGLLNGLFHSTAERDTLLQLLGDATSNQISIQLRLADLMDLDLDAFAGQRLQAGFEALNFFAALANYDTGFGGTNANSDLVGCGALDLDGRNSRVGKFLVNGLTDTMILSQNVFVIALGIPARLPAFDDAEPEPYGMNFMSQEYSSSVLPVHQRRASDESEVVLNVAD